MSKEDLLNELPASVEGQKAIKDNIKEYAETLLQIGTQRDLQKSIKDVAEEKYKVDPKFIAAQGQLMYDELYNEGKKRKAIEVASEMLDTYEGIFGNNA